MLIPNATAERLLGTVPHRWFCLLSPETSKDFNLLTAARAAAGRDHCDRDCLAERTAILKGMIDNGLLEHVVDYLAELDSKHGRIITVSSGVPDSPITVPPEEAQREPSGSSGLNGPGSSEV